ncbi:50S ribosomal protein L9, partial [Candidatus Thioglobus sp.]|nr:50S ribosomal protein L9 [Candidatus Thioglobus sp.]
IELCSSLIHGGLTPEVNLMKHASHAEIPVRVMIRPKRGNFHYSSRDLRQMKNDIDRARSFGFEGVVFGATLVNGEIDQTFLEKLVKHALGLKETAMSDVVCTITANAGEEGKLYGSVSPADIAENLLAQGFEVEKRDINMPEAIRNIGEYEVTVSLYAEVVVTVKVIVIAATEAE